MRCAVLSGTPQCVAVLMAHDDRGAEGAAWNLNRITGCTCLCTAGQIVLFYTGD